jgi:hypothetical protein
MDGGNFVEFFNRMRGMDQSLRETCDALHVELARLEEGT